MTADVNADLIGFEFPDARNSSGERVTLRVTGSWPINHGYVKCETVDGPDAGSDGVFRVRPAAVVRQHKALVEAEAKLTAALWRQDARP